MTTQLSSLRVTADLDASGYKAGADQKVAADNAMTASSRGVAASVTDTQQKISQSGDILNRLSRQYVDGFASAQKFESAINSLSRGVETGKISITQTGPILDGIYKKYGQTADAATFSARGQVELGLAVAAANQRFAQAKPTVEGHASALGIGNTQTMALTHSMRSFVEQMAMGIPVTQAAVSELNHLTYAMSGEDGLLAALKKAGPGLLSAFATPGVGIGVGIAAALIGITGYAMASKESIRSVDDILKDHEANIRGLKDAYGDAAAAAIAYGQTAANEGRPGIAIPTAMTERELRVSLAASSMQASRAMLANDNGLQGGSQMGPTINSEFKDFTSEIEAYRSSIAKGKPEVLEFRKAITEKWDLHQNDEEMTKEADALLKLTDSAAKAALALPGAKAALDALNNGRYPSFADIQPRQAYEDQNNANLYWLQQQHKAAMDNIGAVSPDERRQAAIDAEAAKPSPEGESAEVRQYKINAAGALAYEQALNALEVAQEQNRRQLDQTIASAKVNLDLIGKSTAETEAQKMETSELAKVREDAARNGIDDEKQFQEIYGETIAKIKETSAEYGKLIALQQARQAIKTGQDDLEIQRAEVGLVGQNKLAHDTMISSLKTEQEIRKLGIPLYGDEANAMRANTAAASANAEALARAQFQQNLLFERQQLLRNADDQQIASALQGAGLPVDLNSQEAQMMRYNMALSETKDTFKGFFTDMFTSLRQGKSLWEAFQNAAVNALSKIADKLIDRGLDGIFNSIFGGGQNGTSPTGGGLLGQLFNFGSNGGYSAQQQASTGSIVSSLFGAGSRSTGSMQVQAGVVYVNGAAVGGVGGGLSDVLSKLASPNFKADTTLSDILGYTGANDNQSGSLTGSMSQYASAIKAVESLGSGGYSALGPVLRNGDQALGAYQIMQSNLPSWSQSALGFQVSRSQFLANPAYQDAIFNHQFGSYLSKYGNPQDAASAWFTGGPLSSGAGKSDVLGTTGSAYVDKFNAALGKLSGSTESASGALNSLGGASQSLISKFSDMGQSLLSQLTPATSSSSWFQGLSGLFGGNAGALGFMNSISPAATSDILSGSWGLFDGGGFTGMGGVKQPAGIVHRGEIVWSQDDIRRAGGVHVVEGMRLGYRGYADGGIVRPRYRNSDGSGPMTAPANDRPVQHVQQTNNFIFKENPAAPASQNQIAAKNAEGLKRLQRTA